MSENIYKKYQTHITKFRHSFLVLALLAMIIIQPYFVTSAIGILISDLMFTFVIIASLVDLNLKGNRWVISLAIALPVLGLTWALQAFDQTEGYSAILFWLILRNLCMVLFLSYVMILITKEVFTSTVVTSEEIMGGISVYLLLGVIWSYLFTAIVLYDHQAIKFPEDSITLTTPDEQKRHAYHQVGSLHYFSFVTLTTLGYGDITPRSNTARALAWLEAGVGQMFLAVMMARLVGLHIALMIKQNEKNDDKTEKRTREENQLL